MGKALGEYEVTVRGKGLWANSNSAVVYIEKNAANILLEYPRRELMYMSEEGDEDEPERYFISVVPESSTATGRVMAKDPKSDGCRSTVACSDMPVGKYRMNPEPEFINGVDWYELTKV